MRWSRDYEVRILSRLHIMAEISFHNTRTWPRYIVCYLGIRVACRAGNAHVRLYREAVKFLLRKARQLSHE